MEVCTEVQLGYEQCRFRKCGVYMDQSLFAENYRGEIPREEKKHFHWFYGTLEGVWWGISNRYVEGAIDI